MNIRSATLDDRDGALALMDRAFGPTENRAALWDWAFAQNPHTSDLYYLVADTGTALAAQYAAVPVAMEHQGQRIRGLLSMFTATDPAFQRQGLFRNLAETLYDNAKDTCPIVFGFPNHQSGPTFYKHLSWVDLRPFPHLQRPLRNTGRHSGGSRATALGATALDAVGLIGRDRTVDIRLVDDFTGIADQIWDQVKPQVGTAIIRDESFLNWRFVQSPFEYLRLVAVRGGKPVGIAVLAADSSDGKARLMEFMVAPGEKLGVTRALLSRVIELATESGAYGLGFIATPRHPQSKAMLAAGLLPAMRTRRPASPIDEDTSSFGVRVNGPAVVPSRVLHIDDWYLSSADQDWL
jgi:GNAT superfamily N-acetyltransferase